MNRYEYRLHQIEILLRAYEEEKDERYNSQIESLKNERMEILSDLKYME